MNDTHWLSRFDALVRSGVVSYDTQQQTIEHIEGDLKYHFILTTALTQKPRSPSSNISTTNPILLRPGSDIDTTGYELGPIGPSHFLTLNKFCYARPHLMLLTSDGNRRQHEALDRGDLAAAWTLLQSATEGEYLVFFNGGEDAGCSRMHKHLQLLPTPPNSLASFLDTEDGVEPDVSFQWFFRRLGKREVVTPEVLKQVYDELLSQAAASCPRKDDPAVPDATCPHNFLLTKRWMLVVPRRRWGIGEDAGANAPGMIGWFACSNGRREMEFWKGKGVGKGLAMVGVPRE